jgi:maltose O-acetyltransferase
MGVRKDTAREGTTVEGAAFVLAGVMVGARAMVGADTVVVADVELDMIVGGSPGRVVRRLKTR